jgi:formylglycine-generating enzyme required for sulfatase activity
MSDQPSEQHEAAFHAFADSEMPWLLDAPADDSERLLRSTAKIAFARGLQAGQRGSHSGLRASVRQALQPHLVNQICGLRRHQVEDAVKQLLDYIDMAVEETERPKPVA